MTRSRNNSIAIVDDDVSLLTSLARNLRMAGFDVRTFGSAEECLDAVPVVDVLLADLRLPGIGGIELSQELARRGVNTSVIFMTGHSQQETARELESIGLPRCLRKPFEARELRAAIELLLARAADRPKGAEAR
jgi:FixJ family two-component response regulator